MRPPSSPSDWPGATPGEPVPIHGPVIGEPVTLFGQLSGGSQVEIVDRVQNNEPYQGAVYGRVPAGQDVSAGTYTESVTVTIDY